MMMGFASLYPSYEAAALPNMKVRGAWVAAFAADDEYRFPNSTPFPNPFLSVYWHTKPGADPCTNKSGSEAIGVR